jgi:hypothetical protein
MNKQENLKYIKSIKEVIKFLNETFPGQDYPKFRAFLSPDDGYRWWNIVTDDWFLYMGSPTGGPPSQEHEEFLLCKDAIRQKFKKPKMVFAYLYYVSGSIRLKQPGHIVVK